MAETKDLQTATRMVQKGDKANVQAVGADICVVGAGIAGVSAALEAARLGHKVALVDGLPALGGQAVNSVIGIFCGLYSNGPTPYQLTHGIADNIIRDLGAAGALHYRRGAWRSVLYDEIVLSRWIEETVRAAGITVILGAVLRGVTSEDRRILAVDLATRYGDVRLTAKAFVDATGDAALAWQAGLPCREPAEVTVFGSQMVLLEGINLDNYPEREEVSVRLREKAGDYGLVRRDGFAFSFPSRGTAIVNMTRIETPLEPVSATAQALEGKAQADQVIHFLKSEFPLAFGNARARTYGLPGIRQTRWIVGRQQLTVNDVRAGTRFQDAGARTAWPIELHDRWEGYIWETFAEDHVHYIPMGSLIPPDIDNLVAAGRCIDGDVAALSSVRVMGPCIATGAAAAHALDLAGGGSVHSISPTELQERLKDNLERVD